MRDSLTPRSYVDRDEAIVELAQGRRVLHLGCVGHTDEDIEIRTSQVQQTLHWKLTQAADVTGVDYSGSVLEQWRRLGFFDNVLYGDVEALDQLGLQDTFDVVVAADIIEHLSQPGAMLESMRRFCAQGTKIVITTPHAFGLPNYLRFLSGRFREGAEHVLTFNYFNMDNLLRRHGYQINRLDTCHQRLAKQTGGAKFIIARKLFERVPRLGGTLFVVATRGRFP